MERVRRLGWALMMVWLFTFSLISDSP